MFWQGGIVRFRILRSNSKLCEASADKIVLGSKYSYGSAGSDYYSGLAAGGPNDSVHPGTFAFVGFRFAAADGTHYGWIRLR